MPTGASTHVDAWAFDTESGKAFKLTGSHVVAPLRLRNFFLRGSTLFSVDVDKRTGIAQNVSLRQSMETESTLPAGH